MFQQVTIFTYQISGRVAGLIIFNLSSIILLSALSADNGTKQEAFDGLTPAISPNLDVSDGWYCMVLSPLAFSCATPGILHQPYIFIWCKISDKTLNLVDQGVRWVFVCPSL